MLDKKYILLVANLVLSILVFIGLFLVLLGIRDLRNTLPRPVFIAEQPAVIEVKPATPTATLKPVLNISKAPNKIIQGVR